MSHCRCNTGLSFYFGFFILLLLLLLLLYFVKMQHKSSINNLFCCIVTVRLVDTVIMWSELIKIFLLSKSTKTLKTTATTTTTMCLVDNNHINFWPRIRIFTFSYVCYGDGVWWHIQICRSTSLFSTGHSRRVFYYLH